MLGSAGLEVHPVENAVVLVRDQLVQDVLVLTPRHEHQVFECISIVPAIVHMHMRGSAMPALRFEIDMPLDHELQGCRLLPDDNFRLPGPIFESFDGG